jgi:hypothetical protein
VSADLSTAASCQIKVADWPERDRALWAEAARPADLFDDPRPSAGWRPATRTNVAKAYGRWLGWLTATGELDPGAEPDMRALPDRVGAYGQALRANLASTTVATYLQGLAMALDAMVPQHERQWLWDAVNIASRHAHSTRLKRDHLVPVKTLLAFGQELMATANTGDAISDAVRYRDGLMVMLLAERPIRIKNLQMMAFGKHLVLVGARYFLRFTRNEMKNKIDLDLPLPLLMTETIEIYRQIHRPVLAGMSSAGSLGDMVWVTRFGTQMASGSIYHRIIELTEKKFGKSINPHLFRDCAATSIALDDPAHIDITMSLLGHTNRRTAERYYNHAQSQQASALQYDLISSLRREHRKAQADQARMAKRSSI